MPAPFAVVVPSEPLTDELTVMVAFASDVPVKVGVVSLVRLSVLLVPVSVPAVMSGVEGALGASRSTVCVAPEVNAEGPELPDASEILVLPFRSSRITPVPVMLFTVTLIGSPLEAETLAMVPVAEPDTVVRVKSSVLTLLAVSSKSTENVTLVAPAPGEPDRVIDCTAGAVVSGATGTPKAKVSRTPELNPALA